MGMSSYVMDCEEQFINSVNLRIGGCEHITELHMALTKISVGMILHICLIMKN